MCKLIDYFETKSIFLRDGNESFFSLFFLLLRTNVKEKGRKENVGKHSQYLPSFMTRQTHFSFFEDVFEVSRRFSKKILKKVDTILPGWEKTF